MYGPQRYIKKGRPISARRWSIQRLEKGVEPFLKADFPRYPQYQHRDKFQEGWVPI